MSILPRLSIATKLYAIFALLAIATVALAATAVLSARHHNALTREFEAASQGAQNVERLNGLIYAVRLESRGISCRREMPPPRTTPSACAATTTRSATSSPNGNGPSLPGDMAQFEALSDRIKQFQEFNREPDPQGRRSSARSRSRTGARSRATTRFASRSTRISKRSASSIRTAPSAPTPRSTRASIRPPGP